MSSSIINSSQSLCYEIKKFYKNVNQLNILMKETNNSCQEIKKNPQFNQLSDSFQINELTDHFIKSLPKKKICIVILGQNSLAKSILVNEILSRYVLPVDIYSSIEQEIWRIIKIKFGKVIGFSYNLVDSEFELMTNKSEEKIENQNLNSFLNVELENLRLDESLIKAIKNMELSNNEKEKAEAMELIKNSEKNAENQAILEINLDHRLLEKNLEIIVHSKYMQKSIFEKLTNDIIPVYIYGIIQQELNQIDFKDLSDLKDIIKTNPIFFVRIPQITNHVNENLLLNNNDEGMNHESSYTKLLKKTNNFLKNLQNLSQQESNNSFFIFNQLCKNEYNIVPSGSTSNLEYELLDMDINEFELSSKIPFLIDSEFCEKWHLFMPNMASFLKRYLKSFLVFGAGILYKFHENCLTKLINLAFETARDTMITPKKIEYAREKEKLLFESLNSLTSLNQEELKILINHAIESNRENILELSKNYVFQDIELLNIVENKNVYENVLDTTNKEEVIVKYAKDYKKCSSQIQELVINKLNNAIAQKLTESIEILKENYIGTLKRCLKSLEDFNNINSVPCDINNLPVSDALQQILNSAYQVDINLTGSSNILKILIQRMKELLKNLPWNACPKLDQEWKIQVASSMLDNLSETKLTKIICNQMKDRLKTSHNQFIASLKLLEAKHNGRLERNEENQNLIRKIIAPKFAKLSLESRSLKDYLLYGFPNIGKEIGRGNYGVVYNCHKWGKFESLAVKSVVPFDEKHWNDLALEFYYTNQLPDHDRIVKLLGSVIDYNYGNGNSPAVLLITPLMKRDLYQGLKSGLDFKIRLKISLDVVNGIRFLHSLGLVHRDIKLKNVLLDQINRAKITDLGFCKPEPMISGSVVGTPVHMAPEMFDSKYDNSVDIYAFGILFWYICSGSIALPKNFEPCSSKDDLWSSVKKGIRPEKLSFFDENCWELMEQCWQQDSKLRPHIGIVEDKLKIIAFKFSV